MAFSPCKFYNSDASYHPLFRLLDDFNNYSQGPRRTAVPHWQPKFDVRETEQTYELHGELPGANKEDVNIKFTDPQTILIHGKTERTYTSSAPAADVVEDTPVDDTNAKDSDSQSQSSHQATVEDEFESVSHEVDAAPKEAETPEPKEDQPVQQKPAVKAKYWLTERSIGEFSRSFHFPTRVDQDTVTASFNDGILTIVVPKAKKHEARRIAVF